MGMSYKNVIVLARHMDKSKFELDTLPNMDCMIKVMKVYGDTDKASLKTTNFLRNLGFGVVPKHSLGGNVESISYKNVVLDLLNMAVVFVFLLSVYCTGLL